MYDQKKKFRRSAVTTICYVLAALMLIYTCYQIGNTVKTINEYYAQYGMQATPIEYLTYVGQAALTPLINTVVFFMLATILDEVRKINPAYYKSDEDIVEEGIAKKEARDAKKFEKGEKAAEKAAEKSADKAVQKAVEEKNVKAPEPEPVVADFTAGDTKAEEAEEKPAAKKSTAKKKTSKKNSDEKAETKKDEAKKTEPEKKDPPEKTKEEKTQEKTEAE